MPTQTYKHPNTCPKCGQWPKPTLTVDGIIVKDQKILLMTRKFPPFEGQWVLPGGHVDYGERVESALKREMKEETGLDVEPVRLIGVYSEPGRDPRYHTVALCYETKIIGGEVRQNREAEKLEWFPLSTVPKLAFDHSQMVRDFLKLHKGDRGILSEGPREGRLSTVSASGGRKRPRKSAPTRRGGDATQGERYPIPQKEIS